MDAIDHLLTRGVDKIYPSREALEKVLRSGKKLRLYQGFDPTGTQLHIGHAVAIRKLRQWQELGHHVIFLIGDGTGQAGDPSGKKKSREKFMTQAELRDNARDYVKQASKIVRFTGINPVEILYNSEWLNKLTLVDILTLAGHLSWQQLAERDLYQERIKSGETLNFREALYPLLQGYDSVAMKVDLELGGTDQTFNMLVGRQLVKNYLHKEKFVMTVPLLTDSKGIKIGKTEGNVIGLTDEPIDFYGKIMALGDDAIVPCFTLLTDMPESEIAGIEQKMKKGANPMDFKKQLAFEFTKQFNSPADAQLAQNDFEKVHQSGQQDEVHTPYIIKPGSYNIIDIINSELSDLSRSKTKRLLQEGAVELNGSRLSESAHNVTLKGGDIIKIGKTKFIKVQN